MPADVLVTLAAVTRDIAVALTAGALLAVVAILPDGHRAAARSLTIARLASAIWAASALVFSLASYATIRGSATTPSRLIEEWWSFGTTIDLGQAYLWMLALAVAVSVAAGLAERQAHAAWALVLVAWAVGWQAVTGHAAGASDHHLAVSSMFLHLSGSAIWLGVIAVLFMLRSVLGDSTKQSVRRGSRIALWAAALIVVSGAANAWVRLDSLADLVTTTYGSLLLLKIVLMSVVIVLAAWHRRVNLPKLTETAVQAKFWRVMMVDVGALLTIVLVAVVLARTAPPVPAVPYTAPTPAQLLTGYALPPAPTLANWLTLWRLEIISLFALVAVAAVYLRWVRRLRKRGDDWPWHRPPLFLAGIAILVWITQGGPAVYGMVSFSGHMIEHMFLVMVAPIPLVLGAPVTLALRALPSRTDGSRGPRDWIRAVVESRLLRFLANPVVAAVNFAGSLVFFYYTPVFEFALTNHAGHLWMLAHFTAAGYFFVNALVGVDPGPSRPGYPQRILLLFATMAFHAFFGVALMSSEVLLAPRWFGLMGRDWGADAIADQQYGGQLAWGIGELPVVLLAIGVFVAWRRADTQEGRRKDRQADRDGDAELKAYNAMLARISDRDSTP